VWSDPAKVRPPIYLGPLGQGRAGMIDDNDPDTWRCYRDAS
jgi:hypothetical protein